MHSSPMNVERQSSGQASAATPPAANASEYEAPSKTKIVSGTNSSPLEGDLIAPYLDLTNCTKADIPWHSLAARAILKYGVKDFTCRNFEVKSWPVRPKDPGYETDPEDDDDVEESTHDDVEEGEGDVDAKQETKFHKEQLVRAKWRRGRSWYNAVVEKVNVDGTYALRYDDGDIWSACPEDQIKALEKDDGLHTELRLGMGIHEGDFKGEKVFLEITWLKGEPKSFKSGCNERELIHNKFMSVFVEGIDRADFLQEFLEEMIRRIPVEELPKRKRREFKIYRWNHCDGRWQKSQQQVARKMRSVILPQGMMKKIHKDMKKFLSPATAQWYETFGIPYKRSYLFHGVPGSGKTSLITALAGKLQRNVCFLSAHHPAFSDDAMKKAMERLPENAFLIMEDIDSLFNQRDSMNDLSPLTFTGLLNCLDGIGHATGQIVIMTTNYIDRLDEALIRAGRADMWVEFKHATEWQLTQLFKWFYHKKPEEAEKWAETFAKNCVSKFSQGVTIAEMEQHFVDNLNNSAEECAKSVLEYDMPMRKFTIGEKAKKKKEYEESKDSTVSEEDGRNDESGSEKEDSKSKSAKASAKAVEAEPQKAEIAARDR